MNDCDRLFIRAYFLLYIININTTHVTNAATRNIDQPTTISISPHTLYGKKLNCSPRKSI